MDILTKWVCFNGLVGITKDGNYYDLSSGKLLNKEYYAGALSYRAVGSKKRYSYKKCNETKTLKEVKIIEMPF